MKINLNSSKNISIFVHDITNKIINIMTINGQSAVLELSNEQLQVLLTGKFGDGHLCKTAPNNNYFYVTNCIYEEYIKFKMSLLGNLISKTTPSVYKNKGFTDNLIYRCYSKSSPLITHIAKMSIEESLDKLDDLGVALWLFDDSSLHKTKLFYNINTHKYSKEVHMELLVPFFKKRYDIIAKPTLEHKKDGREFWYLRIGKWDGSAILSQLMSKYHINCYNYKLWNSETIQKWSKLQEELKSVGRTIKDIHPKTLTSMLNKIVL